MASDLLQRRPSQRRPPIRAIEATPAHESVGGAGRAESRLRDELRTQYQRFDAALNNMIQGLCMFDAEQRLIVCNDRYLQMYGFAAAVVKPGIRLREIMEYSVALGNYRHEDALRAIAERPSTAKMREQAVLHQRLNDGRVIAVMHQPMAGGGSVATYEDVTQTVRAEQALRDINAELEQRVALRTAELQSVNDRLRDTLEERDLLLREVNHRVKNNLQLVEALLAMQSRALEDERAREAFLATRLRVAALGLVHQQLLKSRDLASFNLREFLTRLTRNMAQGAGAELRGITLRADIEPLPVDLDFAIPLGLLLNELLANCFKHAFPDQAGGRVDVTLRLQDGAIVLTVRDDGVGMGGAGIEGVGMARAAAQEQDPAGSTGSRIVQALLAQLDAVQSVTVDHGTRITVAVPMREDAHDG